MQANPIILDPNWLKHEEALMKRLHQIVSGTGDGPFSKTSGYAWQLDASNDWWAEINEGRLIIAHRYTQQKADAVACLCEVLFGMPDYKGGEVSKCKRKTCQCGNTH